VLPQVRREPRPAGDVQAPAQSLAGRGVAPRVGDRVRDPAVRAVHPLGGVATGLGEPAEEPEQRRVALGEVGRLGGPVVLLGVDVEVEVVRPRRGAGQPVVPDALQGQRQRGVPARAGHGEIPPVLEVQGEQVVVALPASEALPAYVGGRRDGLAQIDGHPPHQPAVVLDVRRAQRLVAGLAGGGDQPLGASDRVVTGPIGTGRDQDHRLVRAGHLQRVAVPPAGAALGPDVHPDLDRGALLAVAVQRLVRVPAERHAVVGGRDPARQHGFVEPGGEAHGAGTLGGDPQDDDAVRVRGEDLAGHAGAVVLELGPHDADLQVEGAAIVPRGPARGERETQMGEGQVGPEGGRPAREMLRRQSLRLPVLPREEQPPDRRHLAPGGRAHVGGRRRPGPGGRLGEGDPFDADTPVDHAAEPPVADRQRLGPALGGPVVPEVEHGGHAIQTSMAGSTLQDPAGPAVVHDH